MNIYNATLERISRHFPDGNMIPLRQAAEYLGVDYRTLERNDSFPVVRLGSRNYVAQERLALWIAGDK